MSKIITEINNYADTLDYIEKEECNTYRKHYKGFEYWILRPHYWENRYTVDYLKYFHLCGYVVIPKKSKYYIDDSKCSYNVECHGGLTYAGSREHFDIEFCIGFDCNHLDDAGSFNLSLYSLESNKSEREFYEGETYKTANYVEQECKSIINQLIRNLEDVILLGSILKHIRIFNKQTQLELAKNLNISRSYISEIESNNKTPTIEILQKYSDVFNIPLSTIILFAEEYGDKKGLRKKAKSLLAKTAVDFLDWICKEDEKK